MLMNEKEEELNSIIMELRRNYTALQEKFEKEESDKLVRFESRSLLRNCVISKI